MTTHGRHRRPLSARRRVVTRAALVAVGFVVAASGVAWGYFSSASAGYGAATAGTLAPPASFSATPTSPTEITLAWTAPSTPPKGSYTYVLAGPLGSGGSCNTSMASGTSKCTVEGLTPGTTYTWTIQVRYETWFSGTKPASAITPVPTPSFVGVGPIQTWIKPTTKQVAYPAGVEATDLLVLIISRSHNNTVACPKPWSTSVSHPVDPPSVHGFLEVCATTYISGTHVTLSLQGTAVRGSEAEVAAFANVTKATPFDSTPTTHSIVALSTATSAGTYTPPNFSASAPGDMALSVVMENSDTTNVPSLTLKSAQGFTALTSGGQLTTDSSALNFAYKSVQATGPVSFPTWQGTDHAGDLWIGASFAVRANPSGP